MANDDKKGQHGWAPPAQAPSYSPPGQPGWAPPPPGQAYSQPGQGYSQPGQAYQPGVAYGSQGGAVVIQQPQQPQQTVIVMGGCPKCRVGQMRSGVTCCGILCCILFFPLGLICLFTMRRKRCTNCGASF